MLVSVIITVFNKEPHYVTQCVNSILNQTLRPEEFEIILVDDASTLAETIETVDVIDQQNSRVNVIRHPENLGPNEARRTGVHAATGDYVLFVDGDDMLTSDAVESLRMEAIRSRSDVILSFMYRWNTENKSFEKMRIHGTNLPNDYVKRMYRQLSGKSSVTMCGRLIRRSILTDRIFDIPKDLLHEDLISLPRVMFAAHSVSSLNRYVYYYRWAPGSITSAIGDRHIAGIFYAAKDWLRQARAKGLEKELAPAIADGLALFASAAVRTTVSTSSGDVKTCLETLRKLWDRLQAAEIPIPPSPDHEGIRFLQVLFDDTVGAPEARLPELIAQTGWDKPLVLQDQDAIWKFGIKPTHLTRRLFGKIVIICQVDYHFRNAAAFAKQLALLGHRCVILDNSSFAAGGKRPVTAKDRKLLWRTEYIQVKKNPYHPDWLSTAQLVITFNDFNDDFHEALEYRRRLGLRTVCLIEGINDFLRVDFDEPRYLPYRRCDTVFLAGKHDEIYFPDRETHVIGLPGIERLAEKKPEFPKSPMALLNLNFTYGAREYDRKPFLAAAQEAFEQLGWNWKITQHPMDKGDLTFLPKSNLTQYQLIDKCTVFVSRFATGILEALASGKPAIYFNPHGEKVDKYNEPMGAYDIATNVQELMDALKKVEADLAAGVDFRKRALPFLAHHTGYNSSEETAAERFASAVVNIIGADTAPNEYVAGLYFDRLELRDGFRKDLPNLVFGDLDRRHYAQFEETDLIAQYFGNRVGLMLDVGANIGQSADTYLGKGWTVHSFEPERRNLARLGELAHHYERLHINQKAVSNETGQKVSFYTSAESTGIGSLVPFTKGHSLAAEVETVALADYCRTNKIDRVDFLKIDVEGHDKFVLEGYDWTGERPEVITAEFEDAKTLQNGYDTHDLANYLIGKGYTVYVSEWLPIERYGLAHDWRRLIGYDPSLDLSDAWGNLIAFKSDPGIDVLRPLVQQCIRFAPMPPHRLKKKPASKASGKKAAPAGKKRAWYAEFGDHLKNKSRTLFRISQAAFWCSRAIKRNRRASAALAATTAALIVGPWVLQMSAGWATLFGLLAVMTLAGAATAVVLRELLRRNNERNQRNIKQAIRSAEKKNKRQLEEMEKQLTGKKQANARTR